MKERLVYFLILLALIVILTADADAGTCYRTAVPRYSYANRYLVSYDRIDHRYEATLYGGWIRGPVTINTCAPKYAWYFGSPRWFYPAGRVYVSLGDVRIR